MTLHMSPKASLTYDPSAETDNFAVEVFNYAVPAVIRIRTISYSSALKIYEHYAGKENIAD